MPQQTCRRLTADPTPTERLMRAIDDIDKKLELARLHDQPAPISAYRARSILQRALARCRTRAGTNPPSAG